MLGPLSTNQDAFITPIASDNLPWRWRLVHAARLVVARQLAAVRLHRWRICEDTSHIVRRQKWRTRLAEVLIPWGNRYLRAQGALSEVLRLEDWIEWELVIAARLGRDVHALPNRTGIEQTFISGTSLADLLLSNIPIEQKLQGVFQSASALRQLHLLHVTTGRIQSWPISHGDATSRNVIVDQATGIASWIDFDMRHRFALTPLLRQADDLRSLLWSSATSLPSQVYGDCSDAVCQGYGDVDTIREAKRLTIESLCPNVFQLGQAPLTAASFAHLRVQIAQSAMP